MNEIAFVYGGWIGKDPDDSQSCHVPKLSRIRLL